MTREKRFAVDVDGDVTVVRLNDPKLQEMILITELHDEFLAFLEQHQPHKLVVDFAQVTQCSSAVINSMLLARKRLAAHGGRVRLCTMHKQVREAFRVLRLDGTLFEIFDTLPKALHAFERD